MAYVLDASAIIALVRNEKEAVRIVGNAIDNDRCYVTVPTLATLYYSLYESEGEANAEHWLQYMASGVIVKIEPCADLATLRLVAQARMIVRLPLDSMFAAALAKLKGIPVITTLSDFEDVATADFCQVRWL